MPDDTSAGAALHDFIGELRAAFERAGPPTYKRLETLSERCRESGRSDGRRILVLPHSTTHDILSGKRGKLPPWPWIASFLQVLRVAATENGLDPAGIGPTGEWHARYLAARSASLNSNVNGTFDALADGTVNVTADAAADAASAGTPLAAPAVVPADGPEPAGGDGRSGAVPVAWHGTGQDAGQRAVREGYRDQGSRLRVPPLEPTSMLRRYVESYGRTGLRLLRHAEADEGRDQGVPAYRLATLLACENRPHEALYWLQRAARAGHALARRLAAEWDPRTDPWPPYYWKRGQAAFDVGIEYEAARQPHAAAVFFDRAADNGHAEAAYRAGLHRMQRGQPWEAMLLFNRAADAGYAPAQPELDGLLPRYHGDAATGAFRFGHPGG
ncbi:sel1 repeat family protein [Actinomadura roseirufa]|uniref:sel1 repeat family protein n=1 Tax=Actinomadura roseirufa TaxID=2094049 RepID=UPI001041A3AF|nr:sel1 repeat family protein [Actinomadura roseirufa]